MSEAQQTNKKKQADELPADLRELIATVATLPEQYRSQVEPLLKRVTASTRAAAIPK